MTGRRGGLAAYLAVRHIARRPGGVRTTIVLATALALTSFAVTAWAVGRQNYQRVAAAEVGAPAVLTVSPPQGGDLGAIVDRADPTGRRATVVDNYVSLSSGSGGDVTLGVDPQRFARIAAWQRDWAGEPLPELARKLDPPAPPPVVLSGNAMRVTVRVNALSLAGEQLSANVTTGASPVSLGSLPRRGTVTLTGPLVGCPCVLQSLQLGLSGAQISRGALSGTVSGNLVISSLEVRDHGRWRPARAGALADGSAWAGGHTDHPPDVIRATAAGLGWRFTGVSGVISPTLQSVNTPRVLPALIPDRLLAGRHGVFSGTGLDGSTLLLRPVADVAVVPSAPGNGVIVDRRYAELAAGLNLAQVTQQVWLAPGAQQQIVPKLKAEGSRSSRCAAPRLRQPGSAARGRRWPACCSSPMPLSRRCSLPGRPFSGCTCRRGGGGMSTPPWRPPACGRRHCAGRCASRWRCCWASGRSSGLRPGWDRRPWCCAASRSSSARRPCRCRTPRRSYR